jgi:hypothetical protein
MVRRPLRSSACRIDRSDNLRRPASHKRDAVFGASGRLSAHGGAAQELRAAKSARMALWRRPPRRIFSISSTSTSTYFAAVRGVIEDWFARFPTVAQKDLRSRFRSDDNSRCLGAFWELYLHEVHLRLGFKLERDPKVPGTTKRPDFLVRGGAQPFYLEATTVAYSTEEAAERGDWMPPERDFQPKDSYFQLRAHPRPPQARGDLTMPMVGIGPVRAGYHDEATPIYNDLHEKASRYGRPDHPLSSPCSVSATSPRTAPLNARSMGLRSCVSRSVPTAATRVSPTAPGSRKGSGSAGPSSARPACRACSPRFIFRPTPWRGRPHALDEPVGGSATQGRPALEDGGRRPGQQSLGHDRGDSEAARGVRARGRLAPIRRRDLVRKSPLS